MDAPLPRILPSEIHLQSRQLDRLLAKRSPVLHMGGLRTFMLPVAPSTLVGLEQIGSGLSVVLLTFPQPSLHIHNG